MINIFRNDNLNGSNMFKHFQYMRKSFKVYIFLHFCTLILIKKFRERKKIFCFRNKKTETRFSMPKGYFC